MSQGGPNESVKRPGEIRRDPRIRPRRRRNPWWSALWSALVPGIGQLYNGDILKGVVCLLIGLPPFPVDILVRVFTALEAYHRSERINRELDRRGLRQVVGALQPEPVPDLPRREDQPEPSAKLHRRLSRLRPWLETLLGQPLTPRLTFGMAGLIGGALTGAITALILHSAIALAAGLPFLLAGAGLLLMEHLEHVRVEERERREEQGRLERAILEMAARRGGELSVLELVRGGDQSLDEAERLMRRFVERGFADVEACEDGTLLYRFYGLQPAEDDQMEPPAPDRLQWAAPVESDREELPEDLWEEPLPGA